MFFEDPNNEAADNPKTFPVTYDRFFTGLQSVQQNAIDGKGCAEWPHEQQSLHSMYPYQRVDETRFAPFGRSTSHTVLTEKGNYLTPNMMLDMHEPRQDYSEEEDLPLEQAMLSYYPKSMETQQNLTCRAPAQACRPPSALEAQPDSDSGDSDPSTDMSLNRKSMSHPSSTYTLRQAANSLFGGSTAEERKFPARPVSHTNSVKWVKPRDTLQAVWERINRGLKRLEFNPRSPFVPCTYNGYLNHVRDLNQDAKDEEVRRLNTAKDSIRLRSKSYRTIKIQPIFNGKIFRDGRSAILALPSIWSPTYAETTEREMAGWPCKEEMKEDGDERHTSGFRRFLALPRAAGVDGTVWKQQPVIQALPLDQVWLLPTAGSIAAAQAQEEAEQVNQMEELLGSSFMAALDFDLEV